MGEAVWWLRYIDPFERRFDITVFGIESPIILRVISGTCLSVLTLLMQCYPTCNEENARDLGQCWDLTQDNDANDGGRCWQ